MSDAPARPQTLGLLIRVTTPRGQIQKFYYLLLDPPNWSVSDDGRQFFTSSATRQSETSTPENTVLEADADDARLEQTIERGALIAAGPIRDDRYDPVRSGDRNGGVSDDARREQTVERDALIAAGLVRGDRYGPVRNGDRISLIAQRTRLDRSISINQMMLAYLRANSAAFERGNLSGLRQGVILRIPSHAEAEQLSKVVAATRVSQHDSAWKSGDIQPPE